MNIETKAKYYESGNIYNFDANVLNIERRDNNYLVQLDQTYFYPEGGGQPGDIGSIDGIEVVDTIKDKGRILHILRDSPQNSSVKCTIDDINRKHFTIQHSGQHLVSGVLYKELNIDTLSVHLGETETTIEINKGSISNEEIISIEKKVNDLIRENLAIKYHETTDEGLEAYSIRRESKYSGYIRIVEIVGYDSVPCGGLHLDSLCAIGLIKIVGQEKIRGNVRLRLLIGDNAYSDYSVKDRVISQLNSKLSTQTHEILESVDNLYCKISDLKFKLRDQYNKYSDTVVNNIINENPGIIEFDNSPADLIKIICTRLLSSLDRPLLILNILEDRVNWFLLDSKDQLIDFNYFKNTLLPVIQGKGGGKNIIWQGSGEKEDLKEFKINTINFLAKLK